MVTTSDYGPDSYAFAAGKPLVLLSGANLLMRKKGTDLFVFSNRPLMADCRRPMTI
ncbi:restriction endonuclease [Stutzerimonas frequens]|uniref:restriction endonuclease n=1 Tax=Stutzerimonas frequens TaxID=2968969 RepID=UPI001FFC382E|nr:restriction endonuclease [Stutzerimonas frequens]